MRSVVQPFGVLAFAGLTLGLDATASTAEAEPAPAAECRLDGALTRIPSVPEASGLAASRTVPGRLWTHNDSGPPLLFMLDARGAVTRRIRVPGAAVEDWEAIAVGPCPAGTCLYVADIGDNDSERRHITVYRFAEPAREDPSSLKSAVEAFHGTYPDGPQDAESLLVTPDGGLYIVTKGNTGRVALYRFPGEKRAGVTVRLERVGAPRASGEANGHARITDGDVSPDGTWIVLRTERALMFHRAARLLAGDWRPARTVDLRSVGERQGEGVAFGPDGFVYLVGEAGGLSRSGTFARLACTLDRGE